ncbi:MAG: arginine N-succinyltransferase [Pseudomonadota bacterium]
MPIKIRSVRKEDSPEILALARLAGVGMSSLPINELVLDQIIDNAIKSFAGTPTKPKEENFLFVLEDTKTGKIAGTTGVYAHVGLSRPFYSYKISIISQASPAIGIYSHQQVLHMVNDYNGASELGSLFLHPDYRRDGIGSFLSRCRYMLLAEFPDLFSDIIISEIRGVHDENGDSPFYDNLAKHFFKLSFTEADYIYATQGAQFIADLMPKYPIYVNLLDKKAQDVIGVPFPASKPAMRLLTDEGFDYQGYIDLFDAGPTLQTKASNIKTVRESRKAKIVGIGLANIGRSESEKYMISNTRLDDFMVVQGAIKLSEDGIIISPETANSLKVEKGDMVRYVL